MGMAGGTWLDPAKHQRQDHQESQAGRRPFRIKINLFHHASIN
jgi:hypothetical protein